MSLLDKLREKTDSDSIDMVQSLFNMFMFSGIAAVAAETVYAVVQGNVWEMVFSLGIGTAMVLLTWGANHFQKVSACAILVSIVTNCVLLPFCFFQNGGITSNIGLWFVLGIVYVFMLVRGSSFVITLSLSLLSVVGCYVTAYARPELVKRELGRSSLYGDNIISVLMVSCVIGSILHIQMKRYADGQRQLLQKQKELETVDKSQNSFFANMSHELRTPINTIIGLNEMNLREHVSGEVEENCLYIQNAGRMLLALINDVLDFSKIQSGNMEIVNDQYEMIPLINDLYMTFKARANRKKLKFVLDISSDIPSILWGDEIRLKQIVSNLLTNAIKYTDEGKVVLQIKCQKPDNHSVNLRFSVADTGMGIKKEDIPFLFDEFKRVDAKKNNAIEGTGLGLAICKRLATMMGGEIVVDSIYHKGSTFTFSVNQNIVDAAPIGQLNDVLHSQIGKKYSYHQAFEAPDARILVVDDNEMNRMVVQKLLRSTRIQIDLADSGEKCLAMTREKQYHVILMDHMMPGMDGVETLDRLRKQANGLCVQTPVIALTANTFAGIERQYLAKGFDAYLVKPINSTDLEEMLIRFIPEELVRMYSGTGEDAENEAQEGVLSFERRHKNNICVTVESSCDLSEAIMREKGIDFISCYVRAEDGRFCDGEEISYGVALDYLQKGTKIKMEIPSIEEYEQFFADELENSYQVLHIVSSDKVDGAMKNARKAASSFGNVYVFDSKLVSGGTGLLALYAADMVKRGMQLEEIVQSLEKLRKNVVAGFLIGDSESLLYNRKGSTALELICSMFLLRMSIHVKDGELKCSRLYAGSQEKVFRRFVRRQLHAAPSDGDRLIMVYTGCPAEYRKIILEEIRKKVEFKEVLVLPASPSGSCVSGLGSFGLYYLKG